MYACMYACTYIVCKVEPLSILLCTNQPLKYGHPSPFLSWPNGVHNREVSLCTCTCIRKYYSHISYRYYFSFLLRGYMCTVLLCVPTISTCTHCSIMYTFEHVFVVVLCVCVCVCVCVCACACLFVCCVCACVHRAYIRVCSRQATLMPTSPKRRSSQPLTGPTLKRWPCYQ